MLILALITLHTSLLFKYDRNIFGFCSNQTTNTMCFLEVALHEDFKYSFNVITDEIDIPWSGNISKLTIFLQFKYNKHFIILYGIGHTLYGLVPSTTAISTMKSNIFVTLGQIRGLEVRHRCVNVKCLNKTEDEILAFCSDDRIFKFTSSVMKWTSPPSFGTNHCSKQREKYLLKFPCYYTTAASTSSADTTIILSLNVKNYRRTSQTGNNRPW